jgi:hypothetical protein
LVPFWDFTWDNFNSTTFFISMGGAVHFIGTSGGAHAIGAPGAVDRAVIVTAPFSVRTAQWNSVGFTPANTPLNGIRLGFRGLDTNAALAFQVDNGTLCLSNVSIQSLAYGDLSGTTVFNLPIDATNFTVEPFLGIADFASSQSSATIGAGAARVALSSVLDSVAVTANGSNQDFFVLFPNAAQFTPNNDSLYEVQYTLRLESGGSAPLDGMVPTIAFNGTIESGNNVFSTRGIPGGEHDLAQSPTTTADTFSIFLQVDQGSADTGIPDVNTISSSLQFVNRDDLGVIDAGGDDPLLVESVTIIEYTGLE